MSPTSTPPAAGLVDGERRRDAALGLLRDRRAVLVRTDIPSTQRAGA